MIRIKLVPKQIVTLTIIEYSRFYLLRVWLYKKNTHNSFIRSFDYVGHECNICVHGGIFILSMILVSQVSLIFEFSTSIYHFLIQHYDNNNYYFFIYNSITYYHFIDIDNNYNFLYIF